MANYIPDGWTVIKISPPDGAAPVYKVFATWYGGYAGSDSWKINSGIEFTEDAGNSYIFHGSSASTYTCAKSAYGINMYGSSVLTRMIDEAEKHGVIIDVLNAHTDFAKMDYTK